MMVLGLVSGGLVDETKILRGKTCGEMILYFPGVSTHRSFTSRWERIFRVYRYRRACIPFVVIGAFLPRTPRSHGVED